jgi:hypothetical protein
MIYVTFHSLEIKLQFDVKLAGPTVVVQHDPEGWQQVQRKWKLSITEWQGGPSYELQIPVVFDDLRFNFARRSAMNSVEANIAHLERLAEKLPNKPRTPITRVYANGAIPHDHVHDPHRQWVVATIAWGDYTINNDRRRTRQECTVTLWEYIPDQVLQAKEHLPAVPIPHKYRIKKGDSLQKIAAYFYGDQAHWHAIATLNKLHNPLHPRVGMWIKLPKP